MSKAIIGIKIADGSFYPILEEGKPGEKKLEVTTVRDDQTTVQINLYRSETGNMVDADYVDTLLIDNLVPHPKEEPSFKLVLKLDENNMLSAEIDDPETGEKSDIKVSLVNMGSKSIFDEPDYKLSSEEQSETGNIPAESTINDDFNFDLPDDLTSLSVPEDEPSIESLANDDFIGLEEDLAPSAGGIADILDDFSLPDFDDPAETNEKDVVQEPVSDDFELADKSVVEKPIEEEISAEEPAPAAASAEAAESDDFSFEMPDETEPEQTTTVTAPAEAAESDDFIFEMPDEPEQTAAPAEATESDDFSFEMPDETEPEQTVAPAAASAETAPVEASESDDFSFEMPDEPVSAAIVASRGEEPKIEEPVAEAVLTDDDFSFSTDYIDDDKDIDEDEKPFSFDSLPDFDEIPELSNSEESSMDDDLDIDFSIPETNYTSENKRMYSDYSDKQQEYEYAPSNNMQSALFGDSDLFEETKKQKERKVLVPVIICILCALISLGVLGVVLYLTPSIMKIAGGMQDNNPTVIEETISAGSSSKENVQNIVAEEEFVVEKPTTRYTEQNKIVVLEDTVSPVVPENKNTQKQESGILRHLVKWGDTLWDLAGFYYRNPWLFKIISDANNLKNPDLIISGTYLTIPER